MASLRKPGLGPIVGHTTDTTCRIWIRAGDPADNKAELDGDRRTVGVIGIVRGGKAARVGEAWYFRLHREFDRTGTFRLGSDRQLGWSLEDFREKGKKEPATLPQGIESEALTPDTEYRIRVGTLTVDDPLGEAESISDSALWERLPNIEAIKDELLNLDAESSEAVFRTFPKAGQIASRMGFVLGSCRYPGLLFKVKEADRIFGPIADHFVSTKQRDAARFIMMCGDQIYADTLNKDIPLLRADTFNEFQERYTTAFGAPNLRRLMRNAATYMILDDHEIEDNWTQDRLHNSGLHQLFNIAIGAYLSYQWSHGPRTWGRLLYYNFECAGYPVFVLDGRTQRYKDDLAGLADNHMLGRPSLDKANHPSQLDCLLTWLKKQQDLIGDAPKFIVSASVFVPNAMDERLDSAPTDGPPPTPGDAGNDIFRLNAERRARSDSWAGYPSTRLAVLREIVQNNIQNVIFLGGDIHCSCVAEIEFERMNELKAFCITSSAFYWPFPFADGDPNGYVHDSRADNQKDPFPITGTEAVMQYRSYGYTQEDNFTRIDIDRTKATLAVQVFDRHGQPLKVADRKGNPTTKGVVLQLGKW